MRYFLLGAIALTGLLAMPALAQPAEDDAKKGDRPRREEWRERMIKEFDKDGDGKLSDEERAKARETMRERFGRRGPDGRGRDGGPRGKDKGKKGDRGPDGRRGFHGPPDGPPRHEMLFNRFDEDKNDSLSREEFAKLAEFVRHHHPRPPHGPRFDGRGPDGPPPGGPPRDGFRRRPRPDGPPGPPRPDGPPGPPPRHELQDEGENPPDDSPASADTNSDEPI